jgi:hypothetical protein
VNAFAHDGGVVVIIVAAEIQDVLAGGGALKIQAAVFQANRLIGVKSSKTAYAQREVRGIYSGGQTNLLP